MYRDPRNPHPAETWCDAVRQLEAITPDPPDVIASRQWVLEAMVGRERATAGADLSPWRTPDEAAWTDAELRAAVAATRAGDTSPAVMDAVRAYRRISNRRRRSLTATRAR